MFRFGCVGACVHACVCACVRVCVLCAYIHAFVRACVYVLCAIEIGDSIHFKQWVAPTLAPTNSAHSAPTLALYTTVNKCKKRTRDPQCSYPSYQGIFTLHMDICMYMKMCTYMCMSMYVCDMLL